MNTANVAGTARTPSQAMVAAQTLARVQDGVYWWALAGVLIVGVSTSSWVRWMMSAGFVQPDPGPDPYPYLWVLRLTEFVSISVFFFLLWHTLLRPAWRDHRITLDGKLFVGGFFASALDVLYGMYNPTWAMNAHALSMGTWAGFFPGFASPAMEDNAWGLLWCLPAYIWLGVGAAIVGSWILRRLRAAFPRMGRVTQFMSLQLIFMLVFACIAAFWNRTEVYTSVSVVEGLSLWYGQTYQLQLMDPICIAAYCLGYTWLRESLDDNGRCAVDRGLQRSPASVPAKALLSTLAVCGFTAAVTLVAYQIPFSWMSMHGDSHPKLPSYLQPGLWCGQEGRPLCPGQYLKQQRERYYTKPANP